MNDLGAHNHGNAAPWPGRLLAAIVISVGLLIAACGGATTVPSDLVGKTLDAAYNECSNIGIDCNYVTSNGSDVWVESDWGVCRTQPSAGQPVSGTVTLTVGWFGCSSSFVQQTPAVAPAETAGAAPTDVSGEAPTPAAAAVPPAEADPCHVGGVTYCVLNPAVTQATIDRTICVGEWTATIRPPESYTERLKRQQIAAEGLPGGLQGYEEDHRMPLELGGASSDALNLSPESPPVPNPKDSDETRLKDAVCNNQMTLVQAQRQMVATWLAAYPNYTH